MLIVIGLINMIASYIILLLLITFDTNFQYPNIIKSVYIYTMCTPLMLLVLTIIQKGM